MVKPTERFPRDLLLCGEQLKKAGPDADMVQGLWGNSSPGEPSEYSDTVDFISTGIRGGGSQKLPLWFQKKSLECQCVTGQSHRGLLRVEPKRPCRLQKLGDPRLTEQCQRKLQRHPKRCEHVDSSQQGHKGCTSWVLGAHTMSVSTPSVFSPLWFLLSLVYTSIPHFWKGDI